MNSYEKLKQRSLSGKSILCVGLDPEINKMPEFLGKNPSSILEFNMRIIDATKDLTASYKLNFAFYEPYGPEGFDALKKTFEYIPEEIFTIADAKRGDIGNTSKAYAKSCFDYFGADSITVNPYMGYDSVMPFLEYDEKMVFLLALTSNPGSSDFQRIETSDGPLYKNVFSKSLKWAPDNNLGYVVGATHPSELGELRQAAPQNAFLIPGVGTQGGDVSAVLKANSGGPALINVSRDIIYASNGRGFAESARDRAAYYNALFRGE